MRYSAAFPAAVLASLAAAAFFEEKSCNDIGACVDQSFCAYDDSMLGFVEPAWDCGTAGTINRGAITEATSSFWQSFTPRGAVAPGDFPECDLGQPSSTSVLLKSEFPENVTFFGWIDYTCTETEKLTDCDSSTKNPSFMYFCALRKDGQTCKNIGNRVTKPGDCPNVLQ